MENSFYVTTPIYYVNDLPHIGHAYTTVAADVLARYHRLAGLRVFFLTGTDEHGQKVQEAALKKGITPQEHCDNMVIRFQNLWKRLIISNDDFIRTTEERHKAVVQEILSNLYKQGDIYKASYEGWYCVPDERFWTEKDLIEGCCPECGRAVQQIKESNYFFRMSKYQEWLIGYIENHDNFILPKTRRNEIMGFLKQPL
ncbi:MAG: class I tRNA ligase family protein, partial [Deltaproteobacteria bacterium]|nr:class I tRNA ligase family protein [Deltaproteobacteria bacterium]